MKPLIFSLMLAVFQFVSQTQAAIILSGTTLPEAEGWSLLSNFNGTADTFAPTTDGTAFSMTTIGLIPTIGDTASGIALFHKDIGFSYSMSIEFDLKVNNVEAVHTSFDTGIAFLGAYSEGVGVGSERYQMIYFEEDAIGWGDTSQQYFINTTDQYHKYRLSVDSLGTADVFVDGILALSRGGFVTNGAVAFGDQTNEQFLNGHFSIKNMTFLSGSAEAVPEPSTLTLIGLGTIGLAIRARRRRVAP